MKEYVVDITAYEHVATIRVQAETEVEAIEKAMAEKNISITIRDEKEVTV